MILLSICIPTYNRSDCLDQLMNSLCPQLNEFPGEVDIFVLDNASTDHTHQVVVRWQSYAPACISYEKHLKNIGGNANIAEAAKRGSGSYVWVLGDDEVVPLGAVKLILKYLRGPYTYLILNHAIYSSDMRTVHVPFWYSLDRDFEITNRSRCMEFLGLTPGFISAVIAKRGILDSLDGAVLDKYIGTGFNQVYAFYSRLPSDAHGIVTAGILLYARGGNSEGYNWNQYFVTGAGIVFSDLRLYCGYSAMSVRRALGNIIMRYHVGRIFDLRRKQSSPLSIPLQGLKYYGMCWQYWLVLLPLVFAPLAFIKKLRLIKCKFKKINWYNTK